MSSKMWIPLFFILSIVSFLFQSCEKNTPLQESSFKITEESKAIDEKEKTPPIAVEINIDPLMKSEARAAARDKNCVYMITKINDWPIAGLPNLSAMQAICFPCTEPCKGSDDESLPVLLYFTDDGTTIEVSAEILLQEDDCRWCPSEAYSGTWI